MLFRDEVLDKLTLLTSWSWFSSIRAVADGAASLFRWSADGKYLARKGKDLISIYELPSMRLLDKKSLKVSCLE